MQISQINSQQTLQKSQWPTQAAEQKKDAPKAEEKVQTPRQDQFLPSEESQPVTYAKPKTTAQLLWAAEQQRIESFQNMLRDMVVQQGQASNLALLGMELFVSPTQRQQAVAAIAEGGAYSVDAVATRIMDMAKALAAGDDSKLETLRQAVQKGFEAAGAQWGDELPGICQDTYTEVMKRFDDWAQQANEEQPA